MARKALLFAVLVGAAGCAPNSGPLYISTFYAMDFSEGCVVPTARANLRTGVLNVSGPSDYWAVAEVSGAENYTSPAVVSGAQQTLEPANRDRLVIDEVVLSYKATPSIPGLPTTPERTPLAWLLASGTNLTPVNVIGPQASAAIAAGVPESNEFEQKTYLRVGVEFVGHMTGSNATVHTGSFPIEIWLFNTPDPGCPDKLYARDSVCFSTGQDTMQRGTCCPPAGTAGAPFGCP